MLFLVTVCVQRSVLVEGTDGSLMARGAADFATCELIWRFVPWQGIQHLAALERLSLYHNCVSSLAEVLRLRSLPELRDVDLRLNPVVKNEPGYRHFVVHALPKLRQLGGC